MDKVFDLAIIGGGINGCGIARDAAGRGNSVFLCEMNDLASGTSSWSSKLIHGGLRYLEYYEFRLVREALLEREVLWQIAPHIIRPLRFVLPHHAGLRPAWLLRLGLFMYDYLGGRRLLPATRIFSSIDSTIDSTCRSLGAEAIRKQSVITSCSDTSSTTTSVAFLSAAACAATSANSRAFSVAATTLLSGPDDRGIRSRRG